MYTFRATGAAAIAETLAASTDILILAIKLHLSATGGAAENFTAAVDSGVAAAYDVTVLTQAMAAVQNVVQLYEGRGLPVAKGDELDFAYANTNTRTWGLEVNFVPLHGN